MSHFLNPLLKSIIDDEHFSFREGMWTRHAIIELSIGRYLFYLHEKIEHEILFSVSPRKRFISPGADRSSKGQKRSDHTTWSSSGLCAIQLAI